MILKSHLQQKVAYVRFDVNWVPMYFAGAENDLRA